MKIKKTQPTLSLKPTQFSIGMVEIEYKVTEMLKMKKHKLRKHVDSKPIPVVISPWGELCVIDHHHFLFACWHANIEQVRIEIVKDFSKKKMSYVHFWRNMAKWKYAYLTDQFGEGPRSPLYLPSDVRGMADDPYRSLAWIVRKEGGFAKSDATFAEFQWADFFRKRNLLNKQGKEGLKKVVGKAITLAKSEEASKMPGYISVKKAQAAIDQSLEQTSYIAKDQKNGPMATVAKLKSNEPVPAEADEKDKKKSSKK